MTTDKDFIRDFMMKNSEWRGYTVKAIEDLDKEQDINRTDIKNIFKRLNRIELKMAGIAALSSILTTLLILLISRQLG